MLYTFQGINLQKIYKQTSENKQNDVFLSCSFISYAQKMYYEC